MILQSLRFVYYILVLLLPLVFSPYTSELFELNKIVLVYGSAILTGALYTLYVVIHAPRLFMPKWLGIFLLFFLASQVVSTILSVDTHTSLFGFYGRFNGGLLSTLSYMVLFFVASQIATHMFVVRLLLVSLSASILVMVWGILAKFGADPACIWLTSEISNTCWSDSFKPAERMFATLGQPNWLAAYLGIHFFLAISYFMANVKRQMAKNTFFYFLFFIFYLSICALCIYWTGSRSGLLGLVVGCIALSTLFLARKSRLVFYTTIAMAVLISVTAGLYAFGGISGKALDSALQKAGLIQKVETANASVVVTDSAEIRRIVWEGATALVYKYPIFGTGVETFGFMYPSVRPDAHNATSEWDFVYHKAHNEFLNYAATTGFLGLLSYLFLCACIIWLAVKKQTIFAFSLAASLVSQLTSNFFGFSTTTVSLWFFLSAALLVAEKPQEDKLSLQTAPLLSKLKNSAVRRVVGGVLASVWLLLLIPLSGFYLADLLYSQSQIDIGSEDYGGALGKLNVAESLFTEPVYEDQLAHLFGITAAAAIGSSEVTEEEKVQYIDLFKYYNANSILVSPKNTTFWRTRARGFYGIYLGSGQMEYLDSAREAAEEVIKLSPNDPRAYQFLATVIEAPLAAEEHLDKRKEIAEAALKVLQKARKLKPDYRDTYDFEAAIWEKLGEQEKQKEIYELILKTFGPDAEIQNKLQELQN